MEVFEIKNLNFRYPERENNTLTDINLTVNQGEFVLVCGNSGCGKTTLLRLLKPLLSPYGDISGNIYFDGRQIGDLDTREQASLIGFVMQNPDNQIVTDKVWHELAFGAESLGMKQNEIRIRVSEMASFFGIQNWFYKDVSELSGGQKQMLNLASVMVMQPSVLILDEPASQLDPISAGEFVNTLKKINRELGTTIILAEHRLEEVYSIADRIVVMDDGKIISDETPGNTGLILKKHNHPMYKALPTPVRVHGELDNVLPCPLNIREGRVWIEKYSLEHTADTDVIGNDVSVDGDTIIEIKDAYFRYGKDLPDVLKGFSLEVKKGELFSIVGGNGTGKSTALSVISALNTPYRGKVLLKGEKASDIRNLYDGLLGVLPQNPQSVFVKKTVYLDLMEILSDKNLSDKEAENKVMFIASLLRIEHILNSHPYDLSGGEQQRAALAKVLLTEPEILLLDEPTKGMDARFKEEFADILGELKAKGVTILMVTHDIEFAAEYSDRCGLMFDGSLTSVDTPGEFFKGKSFYTTSANRMARTVIPDAVTSDDIIRAFGGNVPERKKYQPADDFSLPESKVITKKQKNLTPARIITGCIFVLMYILTSVSFVSDYDFFGLIKMSFISGGTIGIMCLAEAVGAIFCFFPQKSIGIDVIQIPRDKRKLTKRTLWATFLILLIIPFTIYAGIRFLGDRKYYFVSMMVIIESMIPFCMIFESRSPKARELVIISVLCAIAVAGRWAFFMLPQFKPVVAVVIISAVCFGGETGFLVGAVSGFVSNFFYGQGPWTPWQMFAFGIIGFIAGILFTKGVLKRTRASLCVFGFVTTIVIYGGLMNPSSVIMMNNVSIKTIVTSWVVGFPMDIVHGAATAFFIWFISEPMIEKLERIKIKYGLVETEKFM